MSFPYPAEGSEPPPASEQPGGGPPVADPGGEPPASPAPATEHRSRWAALVTGLVVAALGAPLGWLWAEVAPRLLVIKAENGGFLYAETEPEQPIAAEGWFAIIGAGAGIALALAAWILLRRYRGVAMLAALAVGSLVAAALASWVGYRIGHAQFVAANSSAVLGDRIHAPLSLAMTNLDPRAVWKFYPTGVLAVQALFGAFTYTFLAGFSAYADLRGEHSADQFGPGLAGSSDTAIGTART